MFPSFDDSVGNWGNIPKYSGEILSWSNEEGGGDDCSAVDRDWKSCWGISLSL